jgi:high-affinity Fe2+/Pb2+ permease
MTVWNITKALPDNAGVGDVLHGLVGYAARPTLLQVGVWLLFLAGSVAVFFLKPRRQTRTSGADAPTASEGGL